ncbi:hypothetical protein E2C01_085743 [Portunus trituberculatus]|uniref:Uncharacterized protein n=1 Tax=Portunus trituberculatus TaxID=210409 RepID=A0A5B7J7P2_PORTR|nr:hypothetical protein [Portunus trituberculatus]
MQSAEVTPSIKLRGTLQYLSHYQLAFRSSACCNRQEGLAAGAASQTPQLPGLEQPTLGQDGSWEEATCNTVSYITSRCLRSMYIEKGVMATK